MEKFEISLEGKGTHDPQSSNADSKPMPKMLSKSLSSAITNNF